MTNFLAILDLDNNYFHSASDEMKEALVNQHLEKIETQVLTLLTNAKDLSLQYDDNTLKLARIEINKRLENGSRLYYVWLRHLTRMVGKDFLQDKESRDVYQTLAANNAEKENDRTIYEEKYIANLVKEFHMIKGDESFENMTEAEIIAPYFKKFEEMLIQAGRTSEEIENFRKYVFDRLEAEININSHPELQRGKKTEEKKVEQPSKEERIQQTEQQKETVQPDVQIKQQPQPKIKVVPEEKLQIPSFMQSTVSPKHKIVINGKEYTFRENDFPREVKYNPNRLDFELIYNALKCYQDEVNETQLQEIPKKLFDRIAYRFKKFVASLTKTDYKMSLDGREFTFDSNELYKYRSKNGPQDDIANLAYGKYRNVITYPNHIYRTDDDFKNLLNGQVVHISGENGDDEYVRVFDHDLKDEELHDAATRKVGYTRIAYEVFERERMAAKRRRQVQTSQKTEVRRKIPEDGFKPIQRRNDRDNTDHDDFGDI